MSEFEKVEFWLKLFGALGENADPYLYRNLINEEYKEFCEAQTPDEAIKEACDLIWALIGYLYSARDKENWPEPVKCFNEVYNSNISKIPIDGKIIRREDGKVLKPGTYKPADVLSLFNK